MSETLSIPCPIDLEVLGETDGLSAAELGALALITRRAWRDGCRIDEAILASVARMSLEEWAAVAPRVLGAADAERAASRFTLRASRKVYEELLSRKRSLSEKRSAAARVGVALRSGAPPTSTCQQVPAFAEQMLKSPLPPRERGSRAPGREALERSDQEINLPERSSARMAELPTAPQLAGAIFAGLEDKTIARILAWRKARIIDILTVACEGWDKAKRFLPNDWRDMVHKAACDPKVEPALTQIAVNRADVPEVQNPLAYAVSALGVRKGGKKLEPHLSDQGVIDLWVNRERVAFQTQKTLIAAEEASRRITQHAEEARRAGGVA